MDVSGAHSSAGTRWPAAISVCRLAVWQSVQSSWNCLQSASCLLPIAPLVQCHGDGRLVTALGKWSDSPMPGTTRARARAHGQVLPVPMVRCCPCPWAHCWAGSVALAIDRWPLMPLLIGRWHQMLLPIDRWPWMLCPVDGQHWIPVAISRQLRQPIPIDGATLGTRAL